MPETEQNKQTDFMIEKIKERPVNKRRLLRRTLITASLAVIFGLVACLTFLILEPVFSNWLSPEEKPEVIIFPQEAEEMSPEDMKVQEEEPSLQEAVESVILEDQQLQKIMDNIKLDKSNMMQMFNSVSIYKLELNRSMVVVTGVTSDVGFMDNTFESQGQTYGVIIASNGQDYLILTDKEEVNQAESIKVTFSDGSKANATIMEEDTQTGLAVIAVSLSDLKESTKKAVKIATLGSSNIVDPLGTPVIALGCPMGMVGTVGYGILASSGNLLPMVDANYELFLTDILGSANATGVLFDMQGHIFGIITKNRLNTDLKNNITAIGVSELRRLVQNMSNGKQTPYMGISGMDVTEEAHKEEGVPYGAYVKDVEMGSPAMLAGIQKGDVLYELGEEGVQNFYNYMNALSDLQVGHSVKVKIMRQVQDDYRSMEMEVTLIAVQ